MYFRTFFRSLMKSFYPDDYIEKYINFNKINTAVYRRIKKIPKDISQDDFVSFFYKEIHNYIFLEESIYIELKTFEKVFNKENELYSLKRNFDFYIQLIIDNLGLWWFDYVNFERMILDILKESKKYPEKMNKDEHYNFINHVLCKVIHGYS